MTQKAGKNKVVKQMIEDFKSSDDNVVLKALTKSRDKGKTEVLEPMFDLYETTQNEKVKKEIKSILADIKDSYALDVFIEKLGKSATTTDLKEMLLYALWNSNLNAVDFIPEIVEVATTNNYMVALEALTVIENLDGPFSSEKLTEAQYIINEYFSEGVDEKVELIKSLLDVVLQLEDTAL